MAQTTHRLTAILDLRDRLTRKLKNAIKQTETFRDANGRLRDSLGRFAKETNNADRGLRRFFSRGIADSNRFKGSVDRLGTSFRSSMSGGLISANGLSSGVWGIVTALGAAVSGATLLKATLGEAMRYEMSQAQITAMFQGDNEGAQAYMDMIQQRAVGSPLFSEQDYFANSKSFLALSRDSEQLDKMWNLAERLAAMDPYQGIEGAVFAMRELFSGDSRSMAMRFELDKGQLNDIKNLPLEEQIVELDKYFTKIGFGQDFLDQISDTGLAYLNQIKELLAIGFRAIGGAALEELKPRMKELIEILNSDAFDDFTKKVGKAFAKVVAYVTDFALAIIKNWDKISPIVESVGAAFATLLTLSKLGAVVAVISALASPIGLIAAAVGILYYAWNKDLGGIQEKTKKVIDYIVPKLEKAWDVIKKTFKAGQTIMTAFIQYIRGDFSAAWETLMSKFSGGTTSKILDAFEYIVFYFKSNWETIKTIIETVGPPIIETVKNIWDTISTIIEYASPHALELAKDLWNGIKDVAKTVGPVFIDVLSMIWTVVSNVFTKVSKFISEVMPYIMKIITTTWSIMYPIISGALKVIWSVIKTTFGAIWDLVKLIMNFIMNGVETGWDFVAGTIKGFLQIITGDFDGAWQTWKDIWGGLVINLTETFVQLADDAYNFGKNFLNNIASGLLDTKDALVETAKGVWEGIKGIFDDQPTVTVRVRSAAVPTANERRRGAGSPSSRAGGLDYVPYDGFLTRLHKGERVQTAEENQARKSRKMSGSSSGASVVIQKFADQIIIREEADLDKLADKFADKIFEAGGQMA